VEKGGAQRSALRGNEPKKTGASSARAPNTTKPLETIIFVNRSKYSYLHNKGDPQHIKSNFVHFSHAHPVLLVPVGRS
jgi:hypothetical protein